jgi:membrane-associated phospholipid phosphatase
MANDLKASVERFDAAVDTFFDRWRGHKVPDTVFATASRVAEFSVGWQVAGVLTNLGSLRRRQLEPEVRFASLIGLESLVVNQGIKRLAGRARPVHVGEHLRLGLRHPVTSSFPSGHSSSAFFAATLLSEGHPRRAPLWFGLALVVAASRPYVRLHHASDVVAGAATGLVLAKVAQRLWPRA